MSTVRHIDLSADLGEHDGDRYSADEALLDVVTSASIACGAHAGSREVIERTVESAAKRGVAVGAHPSYPDREGFGRRVIEISAADLRDSILSQILVLQQCCRAADVPLRYVKPHGALYNRAAVDEALASMIVEVIVEVDPRLVMLALPTSAAARVARSRNIRVAAEGFPERGYAADGMLAPRGTAGAIISDPQAAAKRAIALATGSVRAVSGERIDVTVDSLCVHGDNINAHEIVRSIRRELEDAGVILSPFA